MARRFAFASLTSSVLVAALALALGCGTKPGPARCDPQDQGCDPSGSSGAGGATGQGSTTGSSGSSATTTSSSTSTGSSTTTGSGGSASGDAGRTFTKRIVAYLYGGTLRTWATDMPWQKVSHVHIAFATLSGSTLTLGAQDPYLGTFVTAAHASGAKVLVAFGGAGQGSTAIAAQYTPANVDTFVNGIANYVDAQNLDGIDVDVETSLDSNYALFVDKLVAKLRPKGKLVTAALAQWFAGNLPTATYGQFDYVSIMSFDHCGNSPCEHSTYDAATREMEFFRMKGVPMDRLVLGVPFYCWCWGPECSSQTPTIAQVLLKYPSGMDYIQSGSTTYSCNGPATILKKTQFARGYGGIMIWHIAQDAGGDSSLLKVIADNL